MIRSTFPGGWPGAGLLLLRAVIGVTAVVHGSRVMGDGMSAVAVWSVALVATCAGAALLLGLLTTVASALVSVGTIAIALGWIPWSLARPIDVGVSTVFFVSMGVAIALLGPGAVSVDARLRGRREIVIPGNTRRTDR